MPRDARVLENTQRLREVNERTATRGAWWESAEQVGFVCECSKTGCRSTVYLTVAEFREIRDTPGRYVTAPGHTVSTTEATRRAAHGLRDDAQALKAQAEHQISRARKLTEGG